MNIKSLSLRKVSYWILPPIFYKIFNTLHLKFYGQVPLNNGNFEGTDVIRELRNKKFSYFFDERIISDFCDEIDKDNLINQPVLTRNKKNQKYLDDLTQTGLCVIKGLFEKKNVSKKHDELVTFLSKLKERASELVAEHGKESGLNVAESHSGVQVNFELMSNIMRVWDIDLVQKNLLVFKEDPTISDVCNSYFGGNAGTSRLYAEYKYDPGAYDPNFQLHSDTPFRQLKVFMLLNDISEENAPLVYYKKSHKIDDWRLMKDLLDFSNYNKKYNFSFGFAKLAMTKMAQNFPNITDHEMLVTGKAGDVIICETRGVHGGSPLVQGHRLQLGLVYSSLGTLDMGNIPNKIKSLTSNSIPTS